MKKLSKKFNWIKIKISKLSKLVKTSLMSNIWIKIGIIITKWHINNRTNYDLIVRISFQIIIAYVDICH